MSISKPATRPARPFFSSGPCAKRPGWKPEVLVNAPLGRSHRAPAGLSRLREAIARTRAVLEVPDEFAIAIVPASDTGAVELAMWNLLGERPVDLFAWDVFGRDWVKDAVEQLKLDARVYDAPQGALPPLEQTDPAHDVVFTWNGTTAGARVPDADWISAQREGIVICDATSAAFAMPLDWAKVDVVTFSWQKVLGGEAAHGMLVLGPRALDRLECYTPDRPLPKIFRLKKKGKINTDVFDGQTINTPSLLCVEDYVDALKWAASVGGLEGLIARVNENYGVLARWVARTPWVEFVVRDEAIRSTTSVTLEIVDADVARLGPEERRARLARLTGRLEAEDAAYDILGHRSAPPCLRIWCGATVEADDLVALTAWLDWAYAETAEA